MAETLEVLGRQVKVRRPWGVFLLAIVTFGIYYLVWYYKINSELRDVGAEKKDFSPGIAVLAVSLGALLIVPPFVSTWRTFKRIRRAEQEAGIERPVNHVLGFVLFLIGEIFLPVEIPYAQSHLNRVWREMAAEDEKRRAGMRGEPAGAR